MQAWYSRSGAWYGWGKTAAGGICFRPCMLRMPSAPPFDERSIASCASQTLCPINKGQKRWLISDLEKWDTPPPPPPNETREGTNAKSSMLRGEGEKEVKRSPAPVALKIWQVVQFLMHISCPMAPVLGSQEGMQIFLSFPYFLMGAFGALYSH